MVDRRVDYPPISTFCVPVAGGALLMPVAVTARLLGCRCPRAAEDREGSVQLRALVILKASTRREHLLAQLLPEKPWRHDATLISA